MKITVVTNEYDENGGGLAFSCRRFVEMLNTFGHEVFVLSSSVLQEDIIQGGYNPQLGYELAMERKLKSDTPLIEGSDIVISFGGGINGYYGALLSGKTHTRFWVLFRGSDANLCKWSTTLSFYNKFACDKAEVIACLSKEIADNIQLSFGNETKLMVIPNASTQSTLKIKDSLTDNRIVLGTGATNLNEKKGVSVLLRTLCYLDKLLPHKNIYLELVGHIDDDVKEQYLNLVIELGLENQVDFCGQKSRSEFSQIQAKWDFYIQCSICEGMGNSVVEAMSQGIPVVISNTGFVAEFAKDRFSQMVLTSLEPEEIAKEIYELTQLPKLTDHYQNLYTSFFDAISPENVEKKWIKLLESKVEVASIFHQPENIMSVSLHDVCGTMHDNITTPINVFKKFVKDIHRSGYRLCSMADYLHSPQDVKQKLIVCTFDDGYDGLFKHALPIMNKYNFTATVYVCSDYLGQTNDWNYKDKTRRRHMNVDELKILQNYGWEIGSHGVSHQSLLRLNDDEIHYQLSKSKEILENLFGKVSSYAYPYGDFSPYIEKQVKKFYDSAFLLTQGGVYMPVDKHKIHRYYISEIYQILKKTL